MNRANFLKSLLIAPFVGMVGKKAIKTAPKINPAWVDAPYEMEFIRFYGGTRHGKTMWLNMGETRRGVR